jgi:hypothetical protein
MSNPGREKGSGGSGQAAAGAATGLPGPLAPYFFPPPSISAITF